MHHNNNSDEDKIITQTRCYENDLLKNHVCKSCKGSFDNHKIRKNHTLKPHDFAYYELCSLTNSFYVHEYCIDTILCNFLNDDDKLIIDGEQIHHIKLYNRHMNPFYVNQTKCLSNLIERKHNQDLEKLYELFAEEVKHFYNCTEEKSKYYFFEFIHNFIDEFNKIK